MVPVVVEVDEVLQVVVIVVVCGCWWSWPFLFLVGGKLGVVVVVWGF